MSIKLPYLPLWANDIDADRDCRRMSDAQFGRYMRLLIRQWIEGSVPATPVDAMRDAMLDPDSEADVQSLLDRKFSEKIGSGKGNPRMQRERLATIEKCEENRERASRAGKASAAARGSTSSSTTSSTSSQPRASDSVSDSGSDSQNQESRFLEFWKAYPSGSRKVDKPKCLAKWKSEKLDAIADEVLDGLARWKASEDWTKEGGRYICGPHKWLNQRYWEADPKPAAQAIDPGGLPIKLGTTER